MSIDINIAEDGACLLGETPLHPAQGALRAAMADLAGLLAKAGPDDTLVLAGCGLGWHAKAAALRPNGPRLVLFEPDARRLAMARSLGPDLTGLEIVRDANQLTEYLSRVLVYDEKTAKNGRVAVYSPEAYRRNEPLLPAKTKEIVDQVMSRGRVDWHTRQAKDEQWLANIQANFKHLLKAPDLTRLAHRFRGAPALVLGAGPSLDRSLAALGGASGKALLLGAASAIGPLAAKGMALHLAVALEAKDESRQFAAVDPARTWLAAATSGHARHFELWRGKCALFHLQPWVAKLSGGGWALPNGGHASSAAFSLAVLWGCDPIILVGQDLAYSGGRIHAHGRPGGEEEKRPATVEVPGIHGDQVQTSPVFMSYISWYRETAAYLAKRGKGPRIINATAEGAYLPGFEHMLLDEALDLLPEGAALESLWHNCLDSIAMPPASLLVQNLMAAKTQIRQCLAGLERGGLAQARELAGTETAAAAALQYLPPSADPAEAAEKLEQMSNRLRAMAEELYA
ncbi:hypothetical protein AAU61_05375 [Desulfocarbo indianensis]|nr:hypothetical protein AAU61_05375 [Desulfocarbo indianensis]